VPPGPKTAKPDPWALELDNGLKCRIRNGGAWSYRSDGLIPAYGCSPGDKVVLVEQSGNPDVVDKRAKLWTVRIGILDDKTTGSPPPQTVHVRTAYFAGSP
jgi:hypothetical protein